jgi:hypothetical protein
MQLAQPLIWEARISTSSVRLGVFNCYPELRMSRFNAGAFHGRCSHVIVWEASTDADVWQYVAAVEALHSRPFFATPLFEIVDVIAGVEDDEDELRPSLAFAV